MTDCDVLVIGGGPGGATLAALLARRGVSVRVIERQAFPRYHIGESLVPQVLEVLEESGALPAVEAHGFLRKEGGVFRWGRNPAPWSFYFDEASYRYRYTYAFQVVRAEFDKLLLDHARACGAEVDERTTAQDILVSEFTPIRHGVHVTATGDDGHQRTYRTRLVADCSGQAGWLAKKRGLRQLDESLRNLAVHTYFRGANRLSGRDANAIFCEATPDGWFWNIPLHDGSNSVGWITKATGLSQSTSTVDARFREALARSVFIRGQISNATTVGPLRVAPDYSYRSKRLWDSGYIIVGDAGNFIDPVWSTGVFLATSAARMAADTICAWLLTGQGSEFAAYAKSVRYLVETYRDFVHFFYRSNDEPEGVFWKASSLLHGCVDRRDAFIRLVSGRLGINSALNDHQQALELRNV